MSRLLVVLAAVVATCSNERPSPPPADAGLIGDVVTPRCAVRFDGEASLRVRTSERRRLRMVLDPATPGVGVRVGVVGMGLDASLTETRMVTGADGSAETELIAPTDSAAFRVRATAECGGEASVEVAVGDRGFGSIAADAVYRGSRTPERLELNIVSGRECPDAGGDPMRRTMVPLPGGMVRFGSLPADLTFTVWAQAIGAGSVVLAQGCAAPQTVRADQESLAPVLFVDRPLRLAGQYVLDLSLNLGVTATDLPARWTTAVRRELRTAGSTVSYLAREVSRAVAEADGAPDGSMSAHQVNFDTAVRGRVGLDLDAALTIQGLQLESSFDDVASATARALGAVHWRVTFPASPTGEGVAPGTSILILDPGTPDVTRDDARLSLPSDGLVRLSVGSGDIATLTLTNASLPWARVARGALGAVTVRLGASTSGEYIATPLCPVVANALREVSGPCDAGCIQVACRRAIDGLARVFDDEVASQLATRSSTSFRMAAVATPLPRGLVVARAQGVFVGQWLADPAAPLGGLWTLEHVASPIP